MEQLQTAEPISASLPLLWWLERLTYCDPWRRYCWGSIAAGPKSRTQRRDLSWSDKHVYLAQTRSEAGCRLVSGDPQAGGSEAGSRELSIHKTLWQKETKYDELMQAKCNQLRVTGKAQGQTGGVADPGGKHPAQQLWLWQDHIKHTFTASPLSAGSLCIIRHAPCVCAGLPRVHRGRPGLRPHLQVRPVLGGLRHQREVPHARLDGPRALEPEEVELWQNRWEKCWRLPFVSPALTFDYKRFRNHCVRTSLP